MLKKSAHLFLSSPPMTSDAVRLFHDSLNRCTRQAGFLDDFYQRFLAASDEIQGFFAGMDMQRQARMLKASLYLVMSASTGEPRTLSHLDELAERHRHVPARLYGLWLDVLVETAADYDQQFDAHVETAWRKVLRPGIDYLTSRSRSE